MDPRVLLIEGYKLYKFRLSQEQFNEWRELDSSQPVHLKKDCIISSLSFLGLEERGKAEEIARRVNRINVDDVIRRGAPPKETITEFIREKLYERDLLETEKKFQMLEEWYSIPRLIDSNFSIFDLLLNNNEATLFNCHRATATPRRRYLVNQEGEIIGGHQIIIAKRANGELVIIDPQRNPTLVINGKPDIRDYLLQEHFSHYNLFFKGPRGKNPGIQLDEEEEITKKAKTMLLPSPSSVRFHMGTSTKKTITKKNYRNKTRTRGRGLIKTKKRKRRKQKTKSIKLLY